VFGDAVEHRPDELLGGVNLGALGVPVRGIPWRVPTGHRPRAVRAPGSSGLLPRRARRPARSPARRAADEYPAVALLACQVPRAFDALR